MRNRTLTSGLVVLGAIALLLPACSSSGGSMAAGVKVPRVEKGATYMGGDLELTSVLGPDDDRMMTFTLANRGGKPLEDLTARVLFYLPPSGVQAYDTEAVELPFSAFAGESIPLRVTPKDTRPIEGWALFVQPAVTVSREGAARGSTFLENTLECVGITDRLTALEPSLSFEIMGISGETQELLEYEVVLTKLGKATWRSGWLPIPGKIEPDQAITITPDVSGSTVSGVASILLKIQRSVL